MDVIEPGAKSLGCYSAQWFDGPEPASGTTPHVRGNKYRGYMELRRWRYHAFLRRLQRDLFDQGLPEPENWGWGEGKEYDIPAKGDAMRVTRLAYSFRMGLADMGYTGPARGLPYIKNDKYRRCVFRTVGGRCRGRAMSDDYLCNRHRRKVNWKIAPVLEKQICVDLLRLMKYSGALESVIRQFRGRDELSLSEEIALSRGLLQIALDNIRDRDALSTKEIKLLQEMAQSVAKLVETMIRSEAKIALTQKELGIWQERIVDAMHEYVPEEHHAAFLEAVTAPGQPVGGQFDPLRALGRSNGRWTDGEGPGEGEAEGP